MNLQINHLVPAPWPKAAVIAAVALILVGLAWELVLDPLRPGGSWLALKVIPLLLALKGLSQARPYTFKWMSLLIWLYVCEGLVRIVGPTATERSIAWVYLIIALALSAAILMGARAYQRLIKDSLEQNDPNKP